MRRSGLRVECGIIQVYVCWCDVVPGGGFVVRQHVIAMLNNPLFLLLGDSLYLQFYLANVKVTFFLNSQEKSVTAYQTLLNSKV